MSEEPPTQLEHLVQQIAVLTKQISDLQNVVAQIPTIVENTIKETFEKYLILPQDLSPVSTQKSQEKWAKPAKTSKSSEQKDSAKKEEKKEKREKEESRISQLTVGDKKQLVSYLCELPDKQTAFGVRNGTIYSYDRGSGIVVANGEPEAFPDTQDEIVNDIVTTKDAVILGTSAYVLTVYHDRVEKLDISAQSCCVFNNEMVTVCKRGISCMIGGKRELLSKLSSKIELVNPIKVRSLKDNVVVLDRDKKLLIILDNQFKVIKALNIKEATDFCILSTTQIALLFDNSIKIFNLAKNPFFEKTFSLQFGKDKVNLFKIECSEKDGSVSIIGLAVDLKTVYAFPLDNFKPNKKD
ncbi:hypothetical protein EIN_376570 [Entamoeba invadens IP1]|uniref:Uncharacterized protein n=1 Tax=Entamoeba invadens IP1 TaxID=370355 RepID=A0A0A1TU60_ENTIV|nr:hypothetical protein EIN_376570 [Entamoeba invadens IP1]ELP83482.1 hypothetical protein EIN_376570 [Entamoeba invadens IP1]|eukprot:XP_004182828.1 hypothetical protein EIN_376570 [Entamoeba invadens IP1]